jgi:hypothetical protein
VPVSFGAHPVRSRGVRQDCWQMAFGQQPGPPASPSQIRDLLALLNNAGHASFRAARGPMGFSQRQGSGKFTTDEAAAVINQLQDDEFGSPTTVVTTVARLSAAEQLMRRMPTQQLAAELQRRGWTVTHP